MSNLEAMRRLAHWRQSPVAFVREVFGAEPDPWQARALEALPHNPRLALKACKGPGKTTFLAWVGWWCLSLHVDSQGIALSITKDNLKQNLWKELAVWYDRAPFLQSAFEVGAEKITSRERPKTWWLLARSFAQDSDRTQQANTIAGLHGKTPFVLLDEVGDFPEGVVVAAEAIFTNPVDAHLVVAGNPTRTDGPLYRIFTVDRASWWLLEITGDPDDPDRAPRIDIEEARRQIKLWGWESDYVRVNIRGLFPRTQSDKLLGADECQAAAQRVIDPAQYQYEPKVVGVDVARSTQGDRTVITLRQGRVCFKQKVLRVRDLMVVCGNVAHVCHEHEVTAIFVDSIGMGGGVADRLRELGFPAVDVNVGLNPLEPLQYERLRDEIWWKTAEWVKGGGCIPDDPDLIRELCAPTYKRKSDGRLQVEAKDETKKRLGYSPDLADSLGLTFAMPVAGIIPEDQEIEEPKRRGRIVSEYRPFDRLRA